MEAVLMMNSTRVDNKHRFKNPNRNFYTNRSLFPYPSDNLLYASFVSGSHVSGGGYMSMPPASPYPPAVSGFRFRQQQPPLLPLPISTPVNTNIVRSYSASNNNIRSSINQINKNVKNRLRDYSLTPKKSKNQKKVSKKEVVDPVPPSKAEEKRAPLPESSINDVIRPDLKKKVADLVVDLVPPATAEESTVNDVIGPDPKDLPKEVVIARVFTSSINKSSNIIDVNDDVDKFSGSAVFTPSPPPSSLPLPTFFLRSKASCKAEAAGVDVGATDNLRRLLRL